MRSTEELEHQIRKSTSPTVLSDVDYQLPDLADYLGGLLKNRGMTVQHVILHCNLERSYGYQLFNGTRRPTRNFLLKLALLLQLPEAETQRLLQMAGRPPLYVRNRWDAAVLYGLTHGMTMEETESLLESLGEEGLA